MRRVASSRPSRWGMDTIRGLDNSSLHGCERSYGGRRAFAPAMRPAIRKEGSRSTIPLGLERDARSLAGVAAIAIRVAIAHAAPAGSFGRLPAGRVAGGAGRARLAAPLVHALTGGITGCAGMAGHRPPLLHTLAGCAVLRRALRGAKRGRSDQQPRRDRKSTRLNSSHVANSYAVFCLKKKKTLSTIRPAQEKKHDKRNIGARRDER